MSLFVLVDGRSLSPGCFTAIAPDLANLVDDFVQGQANGHAAGPGLRLRGTNVLAIARVPARGHASVDRMPVPLQEFESALHRAPVS